MKHRSYPKKSGFRLGIYVFKDVEIVDFAAPHGVFSVARRFDAELEAVGEEGDLRARSGLRDRVREDGAHGRDREAGVRGIPRLEHLVVDPLDRTGVRVHRRVEQLRDEGDRARVVEHRVLTSANSAHGREVSGNPREPPDACARRPWFQDRPIEDRSQSRLERRGFQGRKNLHAFVRPA